MGVHSGLYDVVDTFFCPEHEGAGVVHGCCQNCREYRRHSCGTYYYASVGQSVPCPTCVPEYYYVLNGAGGKYISVVVKGNFNNVLVEG